MPVSEKPRGERHPMHVMKVVETADGKRAVIDVNSHMAGKRMGKNSNPNDFTGRRNKTHTSPVSR